MKKISFLFTILGGALIALASQAAGTQCYTFETGIPFIANPGECLPPSSLAQLVLNLINISRNIAAILAFVMIVWAGFEYALSGGDTNRQKDAQERIINAIIGLVLLFSFWLILNTINPDILKIENLELQPVNLNYDTQNGNKSQNISQIPTLNGFEKLQIQNISSLPKAANLSNIYLESTLATKLITAYNLTYSQIPWRITDACIKGMKNTPLPCYTTCTPSDPDCATRSYNDAHYYGLAVDLTTNNDPNNALLDELALLFCQNGLDVLIEKDHLHVTLSKTDYNKLGIPNTPGSSPGYNASWSMGRWYTVGNCSKGIQSR